VGSISEAGGKGCVALWPAVPPSVITTPRLVMALLGPEDAGRAVRYYTENDKHLAPWDPPRPSGFFTERYWRAQLAKNRQEHAAERATRLWLTAADAPGGPVLGTISLSRLVRGPFRCAGLGYGLAASAVGHGLMREAVAAACAHMFEVRDFHRIEANYMPHNVRSGRLLEALGFAIEGYARRYLFIDGAWRDHILTSLTRDGDGV
jgi:ribosomal-protein-alanine N-acetyltransferase